MRAHRCCTALSHSSPLRPMRAATRFTTVDQRLQSLQTRTFIPTPSSRNSNSSTDKPVSSSSDTPAPAAIQHFASALRQRAAGAAATEPYAAYGTTEKMYTACAAAGDYTLTPTSSSTTADRPLPALKTAAGEDVCYPSGPATWHGVYSLPPTFATWAQLTCLHLHILQLRIRMFPQAHARRWTQNLLDHFFYAAEEKMSSLHDLGMRGVRTKYLKDLFEQRRGAEISYDEGLIKGDAVLAAAVWRNVFQGRADVDARHVAEVVAWMRRAANGLAALSDAEFASARWRFGVPWEGREGVDVPAKGMRDEQP